MWVGVGGRTQCTVWLCVELRGRKPTCLSLSHNSCGSCSRSSSLLPGQLPWGAVQPQDSSIQAPHGTFHQMQHLQGAYKPLEAGMHKALHAAVVAALPVGTKGLRVSARKHASFADTLQESELHQRSSCTGKLGASRLVLSCVSTSSASGHTEQQTGWAAEMGGRILFA